MNEPTPVPRDCHHDDISAIVNQRLYDRMARKLVNRTRYQRRYARHAP